ncbi:MAG: type II toxin-antitoxin system RelE/ParE family toxin [Tepidiformaceae bacterium]
MDVIWDEEAIDAFEAIHAMLEERNPRVATEFADRVWSILDLISTFPESGAMVPEYDNPGYRQMRAGSYRLMYRLTFDGIHVEAFLHMSISLKD